MNTLVLNPTSHRLDIAVFKDADDPVVESSLTLQQFDQSVRLYPEGVFAHLKRTLADAGIASPDAVGVRGIHGGGAFAQPVRVTDSVLERLNALAYQAPLHTPGLQVFLRSLRENFPDVPIWAAFETAFFDDLPFRERVYALALAREASGDVRRFGFKGLFHDAACDDAARHLRLRRPRMISLCLEPRSELAAVIGRRPVMVTGGATPIEGLPGETSCGDLDPSVVLLLAHASDRGPEAAGRLLSRDSGLRALAARPVILPEVLASDAADLRLARDLFRHHVLRACGAAIAAMGGLDALVFSGCYADAGHILEAWLRPRLVAATRTEFRSFTCKYRLLQVVNHCLQSNPLPSRGRLGTDLSER